MRHYVAYHNVHKMGPLLDADALCVWTNKPVAKLVGNMVWLIVGDGNKPRRYMLASVFCVTDAGETDHPDFKNCVRGSGHVFSPRPNLGDHKWFGTVKPTRFQFGLLALKDESVIEGVRELAKEQGYPIS
jgi:hypothetical protein